ncbi:MAG: P-II family nitrogen regulator [Megasphaera sp.]|jgi:nitrogen regulatory protein P-II 1|uniref:P-II family nitrogen regulator n=1 Tax=Megasphaera sueciensis TaxID=349094 RepID=UPI003D031193|nr:P-II family nitrogen regulator [Megasphaera sp.]MCI1823475.1 P-II family nitrogen regulator [Megasphaera sp.]
MKELLKVVIITRAEKLTDLKEAMDELRVPGMTVTQVYGCGISRGYTEFYRDTQISLNLLPKIKVEIIVGDVPVRKIMEAARKACYTGHIGDGKIFVESVLNVMRIRTGEEGLAALIDTDGEVDLVDDIISDKYIYHITDDI